MDNLVETAVTHLKETTGLDVEWVKKNTHEGYLTIRYAGKAIAFTTYVKQHLRVQQIDVLTNGPKPDLIIARKIYKKEKELLRQERICYIEENGNLEINKGGLFIFIDRKETIRPKREQGNRAFTKTGLKVIFHLLEDNSLINATQREIAERAQVALGNIPQVLNGLVETGFLLKKNKTTYVWEDKPGLLRRWIADYEVTLKPTLHLGDFALLNTDWQAVQLDHPETVWGGEPAADILTNYLRPEKFILFTTENRNSLMQKYRIKPDVNGRLTVLKKFWKKDNGLTTAPPLLIYADLMLEGGKRNLEVAQLIYNEYIEPNL